MFQKITLLSGNAHRDLALSVASAMGIPLSACICDTFPDGETFVQIKENIRGSDVFIVQPTCSPTNQNLMELLIIVDAAKRASAGRITAVIPYFGYARQDRKDRPRVPITAKVVANLLVAAGVQRVLAVHLHAEQIQGFFDIPVDHLGTLPVLVPAVREAKLENLLVASPDEGAIKNATAWARELGTQLVIVAKDRVSADEVNVKSVIGPDVTGCSVLLVDDLTESAGTLVAASEALFARGAIRVAAAVSHGVLLQKGLDRLAASRIEVLFTTDSVPVPEVPKIRRCSIAPLLAKAIWSIHRDESVTELFAVP